MVELLFPVMPAAPSKAKNKYEDLVNVPAPVISLINSMLDHGNSRGVRENHLATLKTIRDVIDNAMTDYKKTRK